MLAVSIGAFLALLLVQVKRPSSVAPPIARPFVHFPVRPVPRFAGYTPPGQIFCLGYAVNNIVQSDASYENRLLGGSTRYPLVDTDYMLVPPPSASKRICLPGTSGDPYIFDGISRVIGSGYVSEWTTPNGGRFAFLHVRFPSIMMSHVPSFGPRPATGAPRSSVPPQVPRIDQTYLYVPHHLQTLVPQARIAHGGDYIGWSGWPSSYQFSFGSCYDDASCRYDAHLCVVYDALAADWFYRVVSHLDFRPHPKPRPKPKHRAFHMKKWRQACVRRHIKHCLSPYWHKRLSWAASIWQQYQKRCGGVLGAHYYQPRHGAAYTKTSFSRCAIYTWARYRKSKVV